MAPIDPNLQHKTNGFSQCHPHVSMVILLHPMERDAKPYSHELVFHYLLLRYRIRYYSSCTSAANRPRLANKLAYLSRHSSRKLPATKLPSFGEITVGGGCIFSY